MTAVIVACALSGLLVLVWQLIGASSKGTSALQAWEIQKCDINVDGFRLLVDGNEEGYLRREVPLGEFRRLQRKRIFLALRSVRMMARNAALLMKVATEARQAGDSEVTNAANRLVFLALQVRMNAPVAEFYLLLKWAFPVAWIRVPMQFGRYERLLENLDWIRARRQQYAAHTPLAG